MKKVILASLVLAAIYLVHVHLEHESMLQGYVQGCKDVMTGLLHDAGVKDIDQNSLNSFCVSKSREYIGKN